MPDFKKIRSAKPIETTLRTMISENHLNVLIDDSCPEEMLLNVYRAAGMYSRKNTGKICVCVPAASERIALLKRAAAYYGLADGADFVCGDDAAEYLTAFLGCSAYITGDMGSDGTQFVGELHKPRIFLHSGADESLNNGIFTVDSAPESICAVFLMLNEAKYPAELAGC